MYLSSRQMLLYHLRQQTARSRCIHPAGPEKKYQAAHTDNQEHQEVPDQAAPPDNQELHEALNQAAGEAGEAFYLPGNRFCCGHPGMERGYYYSIGQQIGAIGKGPID